MEKPDPAAPHYALVVDDNPVILLHATAILEDAGFSTLTAYSAEAALPLLEQHGAPFDTP